MLFPCATNSILTLLSLPSCIKWGLGEAQLELEWALGFTEEANRVVGEDLGGTFSVHTFTCKMWHIQLMVVSNAL